jgi:hypothetical protein
MQRQTCLFAAKRSVARSASCGLGFQGGFSRFVSSLHESGRVRRLVVKCLLVLTSVCKETICSKASVRLVVT